MKKQNIINLIKYHVEKNDEAFISEVAEIAKDFDSSGDYSLAQYMMELISSANFYVPQHNYKNLRFLQKLEYSSKSVLISVFPKGEPIDQTDIPFLSNSF